MKTKTKTMLDDISTTIERVVKNLQGTAAPKKKRMRLGEFVGYAIAQIEKAAQDGPEVAKRRLGTLKRNVDDVLARVAKLDPEDTESENIDVEVVTAFAPTKTDGDKPMEDLTTTADQSSTEMSPTSIKPGTGNTAFAENLDGVAKALQKMKEELDGKPDKPGKGKPDKQARTPANKADGDGDGWPLDLNTDSFRKAAQKADDAPTWGYDPEGVASPKAG